MTTILFILVELVIAILGFYIALISFSLILDKLSGYLFSFSRILGSFVSFISFDKINLFPAQKSTTSSQPSKGTHNLEKIVYSTADAIERIEVALEGFHKRLETLENYMGNYL